MEYNEEAALSIALKFSIPPTTLRVWKMRGSIPDKYFNESGEIKSPDSLKPATQQQVKMMRDILRLQEISVENLVSISTVRAQDVIRETAKITEKEFLAFKVEIVQISNILKSVNRYQNADAAEREAREAVKDRRVKWYPLATNRQIARCLKDGWEIEVTDLEQFKIDCMVLSQKLIL